MGTTQTVKIGASEPVTELTPSQTAKDNAAVAARPAWLPEKFKSPEDMANSYKELESKLGQPKPVVKTEVQPGAKTETANATTPDPATAKAAGASSAADAAGLAIQKAEKVEAQLEAKGVDYSALQGEYTANGKLSPESLASLDKAGIPGTAVDTFIKGQQAQAELTQIKLFGAIDGGKETFSKAATWASQNMSKEELDAYNDAVKSNDHGKTLFAMKGIVDRYTAVNGNEKKITTGSKASEGSDTFKSNEEFRAMIRDPRYEKDPAFRAQVTAKYARSGL